MNKTKITLDEKDVAYVKRMLASYDNSNMTVPVNAIKETVIVNLEEKYPILKGNAAVAYLDTDEYTITL